MRLKLCLTLLVFGIISFFTPNEAQARLFRRGGCGPVRNVCSSVVCAPVIHHEKVVVAAVPYVAVPVAYPVLVPAYQFQYQQPCNVPVAAAYSFGSYGSVPVFQPPQQPFAQPMNYGQPPMAYSQTPCQQQPMQQQFGAGKDAIRELARALLEEINRQADQPETNNNVGNNNGPPVNPIGTAPPQPQQPRPQPGPDLANSAISAMARTCAPCHTGVGSKGDSVLFLQPGVVNKDAPWSTVKRMVERGKMPPQQSHYRLTQDEFTAITQWLGGFSPAN